MDRDKAVELAVWLVLGAALLLIQYGYPAKSKTEA